jgi:hypothetical protein
MLSARGTVRKMRVKTAEWAAKSARFNEILAFFRGCGTIFG